jgi:hypothetical protein
MAVKLAFLSEAEQNNTKGLLFKATFEDNYGTEGVGDLLNLAPVEDDNPDGVTDPTLSYNLILAQPPTVPPAVISQNLSGYQVQITPNAAPTLKNFGLRMFAPDGTELTTNEAYPAPVLAGDVTLEVFVPLQ